MPSPKSRTTRLSVFTVVLFGLLLTSQLSFGYRRRSWLSPSDRHVNFGQLQVGTKKTMPEVLTNVGQYPVTVSSASLSGSGFALSAPSLPLTLDPGESVTLEIVFTPSSGAIYSGSLGVAWAGNHGRVLNIPIIGGGTGAGSISALPSALSFGNVSVGSSLSKTASLSATGASAIISSVTTTNPEFTVSGLTVPLTLTAGKAVSFTVKFSPQSAGAASAKLAFVTGATGSVASQAVSGAGSAVTAKDHLVSLSWQNSSIDVTGYNVYRASKSGGPYARVNASIDDGAAYTDTTVASGATYFYVVTSVNTMGTESGYSQEVLAAVPNL